MAAEKSRIERVLSPLRVGLRTDLHVTRQMTRSGPRYLVHDPVSFQNHAFTPADYRIMTAIVRQRSRRRRSDAWSGLMRRSYGPRTPGVTGLGVR